MIKSVSKQNHKFIEMQIVMTWIGRMTVLLRKSIGMITFVSSVSTGCFYKIVSGFNLWITFLQQLQLSAMIAQHQVSAWNQNDRVYDYTKHHRNPDCCLSWMYFSS